MTSLIDESKPLSASDSRESYSTINPPNGGNDSLDFFGVILQEIEKISKFFVGKLAELRISLDQITSKRRNVYFSHHTSAETDLLRLREIYVQLAGVLSSIYVASSSHSTSAAVLL
jgi:hypothetical protein